MEVSFENEKFEDKIDYDEWSELLSFDCVFDLSMPDDWEDNLVNNELKHADCQEQEVKKEDNNVHVGGGRTPNQPVHIKYCVVSVNYYN